MRVEFNNKKTRTVTDTSVVSFDQFKALLLKHRPKEIWCAPWSDKRPFLVITEYLDEHSFLIYCNAQGDLTPTAATFEEVYKSIRYAGLVDCYFVTEIPIDVELFCPKCNQQHIDKAEPNVCQDCGHQKAQHGNVCNGVRFGGNIHSDLNCDCAGFVAWLNPPHAKHRCHSCNKVWKPFDYPTNGVLETSEQPLENAVADDNFSSAPSKGTVSK